MPIDVARAVGAAVPLADYAWTRRDVILYQLGLGAGASPTDPRELRYVYEDGLSVLPTFAVIPLLDGLAGMGAVEGLDIDTGQILHGEHDLELRGPVPASAKVTNAGRVTGVYDKGSGALVVIE